MRPLPHCGPLGRQGLCSPFLYSTPNFTNQKRVMSAAMSTTKNFFRHGLMYSSLVLN